MSYSPALARLIDELEKLPGIGPKTAQRLAFYLLSRPVEDVGALAAAMVTAKERTINCRVCGNLSEVDPCPICTGDGRDRTIICVVEEARDVQALERTREYNGLYHVLGGAISPLDGVGPENLRIRELLRRLEGGRVKEVIVATDPNAEGEVTAMYLARLMKPLEVRVTRLARGLPVGGDLEYADEVTLGKALEGRREL
ncbi:MAG TPA: recombination mediator RecR [Bacillota bacterium]|jgi:recombination protein RecR